MKQNNIRTVLSYCDLNPKYFQVSKQFLEIYSLIAYDLDEYKILQQRAIYKGTMCRSPCYWDTNRDNTKDDLDTILEELPDYQEEHYLFGMTLIEVFMNLSDQFMNIGDGIWICEDFEVRYETLETVLLDSKLNNFLKIQYCPEDGYYIYCNKFQVYYRSVLDIYDPANHDVDITDIADILKHTLFVYESIIQENEDGSESDNI